MSRLFTLVLIVLAMNVMMAIISDPVVEALGCGDECRKYCKSKEAGSFCISGRCDCFG
uniref:Potassium channel blocker pMeKTx2-4 n=1 Tax=Mesobuthus eupeus TaxID=34648 RepID=A0A088D9T0_MESEU|nr:potassium channel blocker pMeKTx2-4 [Mesobuthus eupeus]